jgi:hypothetical protein
MEQPQETGVPLVGADDDRICSCRFNHVQRT